MSCKNGDTGSLFFQEKWDPGSYIPRKMGTLVPILPGEWVPRVPNFPEIWGSLGENGAPLYVQLFFQEYEDHLYSRPQSQEYGDAGPVRLVISMGPLCRANLQ